MASPLNRQFIQWVEEHYNAQVHSVLGMSPLDRFALDRSRVRFLPPNEANDEMFYVEEERQVRTDNTFSLKAIRFEAPRHLARPHHSDPFRAPQPGHPGGRLLQGRAHGRSPTAGRHRQRPPRCALTGRVRPIRNRHRPMSAAHFCTLHSAFFLLR